MNLNFNSAQLYTTPSTYVKQNKETQQLSFGAKLPKQLVKEKGIGRGTKILTKFKNFVQEFVKPTFLKSGEIKHYDTETGRLSWIKRYENLVMTEKKWFTYNENDGTLISTCTNNYARKSGNEPGRITIEFISSTIEEFDNKGNIIKRGIFTKDKKNKPVK